MRLAGGRALFSSRSLWATMAQKMEAFGRGLLAYFNTREKRQEREEGFRPFLQVTWSGWHGAARKQMLFQPSHGRTCDVCAAL